MHYILCAYSLHIHTYVANVEYYNVQVGMRLTINLLDAFLKVYTTEMYLLKFLMDWWREVIGKVPLVTFTAIHTVWAIWRLNGVGIISLLYVKWQRLNLWIIYPDYF